MEEKAAEGNVAYFAEYAAEELESKLVKYRDEDGRTLLHTAAAAGKLDLVEFFLATDAGRGLVNVSDEVRVFARRLSRRPLDRAAQKKRAIATPFFATEVPTLLSRRRAPPRGAPADPFRAFDARALFATVQERWTPLHSAASAGHAPVVASLLAFGAAPNAANSGGQRAAHYAASKGRVEVLRKLIHAGADCEARDATGATPMHRASSTGSTRIIEFLRTEGEADLETRNAVGQTPLLVACEADRREAVLLLARLGADVDAVDDEKNGAATFAPKLLPALRSIKQGDVA